MHGNVSHNAHMHIVTHPSLELEPYGTGLNHMHCGTQSSHPIICIIFNWTLNWTEGNSAQIETELVYFFQLLNYNI